MEDSQQLRANRRDVMRAAGGAAGAAAVGSTFSGTALAAHDDDDYTGIRVNQVGYPMDELKVAILTDQAMDLNSVSEFEVVDAETGETVDSDSINNSSVYPSSSMQDAGSDSVPQGSDHTVAWADFTDMIDEPGEYKIVAGDEESRPFLVDDASEVYKELLRDVGRLYTLKRSCAEIDDSGNTNLQIDNGHPQDAEAIVAEPVDEDFLADEEESPGDTIDVSYGWYDAGDYGKYVNPGALTVAQMLLAYERNPDAFHEGQFHVSDVVDDEWEEGLPDVLVEAKYELRFLQAMQRSSGALFYKLAAPLWPSMDEKPSDDDQDRYVFGNSSVGTAHAAGAFAMAARIYREEGEEEFADEMEQCARDAFDWLSADGNEDLIWHESQTTQEYEDEQGNSSKRHQDEGSGRYGRGFAENDESYDEPARYWAAAELLRTTGEDQYDQYIQDTDLSWESFDGTAEVPGDVEAPIDWNNVTGLGNYAYYHADGQEAGDANTGAGGGLTSPVWVAQRYNGSSPDDPFDAWTTGTYDFFWGHLKSGISRGVQANWSGEVYDEHAGWWSDSEDVYQMRLGPLHHALGRSATGYSYVTGHGEKSTENPHDRIVNSFDMEEPIPGMLVGGPHNNVFPPDIPENEGDLTSEHIDQDTLDLMAYYDHLESYATNEWAINYTAPLFMMLAEVVDSIDETPEPAYDIEVGSGDPPGDITNLSASPSGDTVEVTWDDVEGADSYDVYVNDNYVDDTSTSMSTLTDTSNFVTGENTVRVEATNSAGSSEATATFEWDDGGSDCEDSVQVDGETVCNVDDDQYYRDVNGDGEFGNRDVGAFFERFHLEEWRQPDLFDYSGNDRVSHGDVVALFSEV